MKYQDYIKIIPGKRSGKPCVIGTRITVYDVLGWLSEGMSQDEIIADYPSLTIQSIQACLAYAADRDHHLHISAA